MKVEATLQVYKVKLCYLKNVSHENGSCRAPCLSVHQCRSCEEGKCL